MLQDYTVDYGAVTIGCAQLPAEVLPAPSLAQIKNLQDVMEVTLPESDRIAFDPQHHFAGGVYLRELTIEAGMLVVGKMHRHEHHVVLASGTATVVSDGKRETVTGPAAWTSQPGVKRAIYTHTRCTFFTTHATEETDLAKIEAATIIPESAIDYGHQLPQFTDELQEMYA